MVDQIANSRTIKMIAEGFASRGISNNAKKKCLKVVMKLKKKRKKKEHYEPICFTEEDFRDIDREHDNPMVILALIHNLVKQILVNQGSLANILYLHVVKALNIPRSMYKLYNSALDDFVSG